MKSGLRLLQFCRKPLQQQLRAGQRGAAPLGGELQQACADRLRRPVGQGYGMTEGTAGIALTDLTRPQTPGSAGRTSFAGAGRG